MLLFTHSTPSIFTVKPAILLYPKLRREADAMIIILTSCSDKKQSDDEEKGDGVERNYYCEVLK
jgi:hypothetical protein